MIIQVYEGTLRNSARSPGRISIRKSFGTAGVLSWKAAMMSGRFPIWFTFLCSGTKPALPLTDADEGDAFVILWDKIPERP